MKYRSLEIVINSIRNDNNSLYIVGFKNNIILIFFSLFRMTLSRSSSTNVQCRVSEYRAATRESRLDGLVCELHQRERTNASSQIAAISTFIFQDDLSSRSAYDPQFSRHDPIYPIEHCPLYNRVRSCIRSVPFDCVH